MPGETEHGNGTKAPITLMVEALYEQPPIIDPTAIAARVGQSLPATKLISDPRSSGCLLLAHTAHLAHFIDGQALPAQTAILTTGQPVDHARLAPELHQTYDWPEAKSVIGRCTAQLLVTEMMAQPLDRRTRLQLFQTVLLAVVETTRPAALRWASADKLGDPAAFIRTSGSADPDALLRNAINVRMFRITNHQPGDMLMDTMGLAVLGLPDLQLHFRNLQPGRVAAHLYNCALYLFQKGDVIEDGNTIAGLEPHEKWRCQHEMSLIGPKRVVIDLDPGPPHAAGNRAAGISGS